MHKKMWMPVSKRIKVQTLTDHAIGQHAMFHNKTKTWIFQRTGNKTQAEDLPKHGSMTNPERWIEKLPMSHEIRTKCHLRNNEYIFRLLIAVCSLIPTCVTSKYLTLPTNELTPLPLPSLHSSFTSNWKQCSLANPILIHRLPHTSFPVLTPNTIHHSHLTGKGKTLICWFGEGKSLIRNCWLVMLIWGLKGVKNAD